MHELTDEDVGDQVEEDETGNKEEVLKVLVDALVRSIILVSELYLQEFRLKLENQIFELLVQNFSRLNEAEESDRQGVFHTLGE